MPYKFTSSYGDDSDIEDWECEVQCYQCEARTKSGKRCQRTVCFGLPFCWTHTRRDMQLRLGDSDIAGAGRGLFAYDPAFEGKREGVFKRGDVIISGYLGETISREEVNRRYGVDGTGTYAMQTDDPDTYVDGACVRGLMTMANAPLRGREGNAKFQTNEEDEIELKALKSIRHDEEILVDYGKDYDWDPPNQTKTWRSKAKRKIPVFRADDDEE